MLFQLGKLSDDQIPDIVCYEKQETVGGLWNVTWRTGKVHLTSCNLTLRALHRKK